MPKKSILIITNAHPKGWLNDTASSVSLALREFKEAINAKGNVSVENTTVNSLRFVVEAGSVTVFDTYNSRDLKEYDAVHFRNVALYWDFARAIANYMRAHGKATLEHVDEQIPDYGKLAQMVLFAMNGVAVPKTYAAWDIADIAVAMREDNIPYPWVIKSITGIMGHDNYLVSSDEDLDKIDAKAKQFIGQPYIPNDSDLRILFFGTMQAPLVFKKVAPVGSHLNNTSQGGESFMIEPHELGDDVLTLAKEAAALTKRLFSGVDVMQNKDTGEWVVLEVNANPALATGAFVDKKIELYEGLLKEVL